MTRRLTALLAVSVFGLGVAGCGPDTTPTAPATVADGPHTTTAIAPPSTAGARVTPDALCGLISEARMSQIIGDHITSTATDTSGQFAVCKYRVTVGGNQDTAVIIEYGPEGKTAIEYTKNNGSVTVPGIGHFAIWWPTSGEFAVEVGAGEATFHVFMMDLRLDHGDIKSAAKQISEIVVPQLPDN